MRENKDILFLVPYPENFGPSQRFRVEIYLPSVQEYGLSYDYLPFMQVEDYEVLYKRGKILKKTTIMLKGLIRRLKTVLVVKAYKCVFIQREAAPIGPPIIEWLIGRILKVPIIYDFDDAIWIPNYTEENRHFQRLKNFGKVKRIIGMSSLVIAGNDFLAEYALKYNVNVKVIPTVVNTSDHHNPSLYDQIPAGKKEVTVGWTGSISTLPFIENLFPLFEKIHRSAPFRLLIISNKEPKKKLAFAEFRKWTRKTEIRDLMEMDIGIMPLDNEILSSNFIEGKCGFKIIQYMALGIVPIATDLAVNRKIIDHGTNGFLCSNSQEWEETLTRLIKADKSELKKFDGRSKIEMSYSLQAHIDSFIQCLSETSSSIA